MATSPPPISPFTGLAPQRKDKNTFGDRFDAFITWFIACVASLPALALNIYNNALEAFQSAATATSAAAAAMATANVTLWASGVSIPQYASVISPANGRTYRRKTATGSGTADPSTDPTNYEPLSVLPQAMVFLASATVTTPVAAINFLNVFSADYDKYVIEVKGLAHNDSSGTTFRGRFAVAGVVDINSSNYVDSTGSTRASFTRDNSSVPAGKYLTGTLEIKNANDVSTPKLADDRIGYNGIPIQDGRLFTGGAVSGFQFVWTSGANFTSGTVRIYGIRNNG